MKRLLLTILILCGWLSLSAGVTLSGDGVRQDGYFHGIPLYILPSGADEVTVNVAPDSCNQITVDSRRVVYRVNEYWETYDLPVDRSEWHDELPHRLIVLSATKPIGECYFIFGDFSEGCLLYEYNGAGMSTLGNGEATLAGYAGDLGTSVVIPDIVERYANEFRVTAVAPDAFAGAPEIRSLTISANIDTIGAGAFRSVTGLDTIRFEARDCRKCGVSGASVFPPDPRTLLIGGNVESIPPHAFANLHYIGELYLPAGVRRIGAGAFSDCFSLKKLYYDAAVAEECGEFHEPAFPATLAEVEFGQDVRLIAPFSFRRCASLQRLVIPDGVEEIGRQAFSGCVSLLRVEIGDGLRTLPYGVFQQTSLRSVTVGRGMTEIDDQLLDASPMKAFWHCGEEPIGSHSLEGRVNYVASSGWSLHRCRVTGALDELLEADGIIYLPGEEGLLAVDCTYDPEVREMEVPERLKRGDEEMEIEALGYLALAGNPSLEHLTLDVGEAMEFAVSESAALREVEVRGSRKLGRFLFNACPRLLSAAIGEATEEIGEHLFDGCVSLDSVSIGGGCLRIGENLFQRCGSMRVLVCEAVTPPEARASTFDGLNMIQCCLVVPPDTEQSYREAEGWKEFRRIYTSGIGEEPLADMDSLCRAGDGFYDLTGRKLPDGAACQGIFIRVERGRGRLVRITH